MRFVVCAALMCLPLLAGCTAPPTAPLADAGLPATVTTDYTLGPLLRAFAVDGNVQISSRFNVLTDATEPFLVRGNDARAGDGQAPAWFREYTATEAGTNRTGVLLVETFQDGGALRERFTPAERVVAPSCFTGVAPAVGSDAAAKTAATDPGFAAFAQRPGQYVYTFVPAVLEGKDCPKAHAAYWRIQYTDLSKSVAQERLQYVADTYTVDVDATSGAVLASRQATPHGTEVPLANTTTTTVAADALLTGSQADVPFSVTLEAGRMHIFAFANGQAGQGTGSFTLTGPDGKAYPSQERPVGVFGYTSFLVDNAPAGKWTLTYAESNSVPGDQHVQAFANVVLGEPVDAGV